MPAPNRVLVIAPHPDDETLGCGGTLLRHIATGDAVHWLIVTSISEALGFAAERIAQREQEIEKVAAQYGFSGVHRLGLPTTRLDAIAKADVVSAIATTIAAVAPDTLYLPYRNDVHSDHAVVFDATVAASKAFRAPYIRRIYCYETLSETEFGLRPDDPGFRPNLFVNIEKWLSRKLDIMALYEGEMAAFPFPRSVECLRSLARLRGSQAACTAAEAFMILREFR